MSQIANSPSVGSIRLGGMVQSNTAPYNRYLVAQINIYGVVSQRGSKEYDEFMRMVPRCVTIKRRMEDGVEVSVP